MHDRSEADLLIESGSTHIGLPLRLPHGGEDLSEPDARDLIAQLPDTIVPVVITYLEDAARVVDFVDGLGARAVQLHGPMEADELKRVALSRPGWFIIKSLVVTGRNIQALQEEIEATHPFVDAYITDTYDPATGRSGATGKTHDWNISRLLVESSPKPVILAGGLTPANVAAAIEQVQPDGVDAHTGVEGPDGRKDPILVRRFVDHALQAFGHP